MSAFAAAVHRGRRWNAVLERPALVIVLAFAGAVALGTVLLWLPVAAEPGQRTDLVTAAFTATSAVCVTGLAVVDTGTHWSAFGEVVILGLIQVGGFGIIALTSLAIGALSRTVGLRVRLLAAAETGVPTAGGVRALLRRLVRLTVLVEATVAAVLAAYFVLAQGRDVTDAGRHGIFLAVSAFNNAGFALDPDSLVRYQQTPFVLLVLAATIVVGGLGLPVWVQIVDRRRRPASWSLHAKLTLLATGVLILGGWVLFAWFEWTNPATLGPLSIPDSMTNALFQSITPRTAGFNSVSIGDLRHPSLLLTEALMFIGGGSVSTAGGIKVSTAAVVVCVLWSESRGDPEAIAFRRRIPRAVQRRAFTILALAFVTVVVATMALLATTSYGRDAIEFEVVSALATVGLSTGITPALPAVEQWILMLLMFLGRVGPITLIAALVARSRERRIHPPEEAPIIG